VSTPPTVLDPQPSGSTVPLATYPILAKHDLKVIFDTRH